MRFIFPLFCFMLSSCTDTSDWKLIQSSAKVNFYYDVKSIERSDDLLIFDLKGVYSELTKTDYVNFEFIEAVGTLVVDCTSMKWGAVELKTYDINRNGLENVKYQPVASYDIPVTKTKMAKAICSGLPIEPDET